MTSGRHREGAASEVSLGVSLVLEGAHRSVLMPVGGRRPFGVKSLGPVEEAAGFLIFQYLENYVSGSNEM